MAIIIWSVIIIIVALSLFLLGIYYNKKRKLDMSKQKKEEDNNFDNKDYEYFKPDPSNEYDLQENSSYSSVFTMIGYIGIIFDFIGLILMFVYKVNIITIIVNMFMSALILACLFGLGNARERINMLANKEDENVKKLKEIQEEIIQLKNKNKSVKKDSNKKD